MIYTKSANNNFFAWEIA